jgi:hypothetical protein
MVVLVLFFSSRTPQALVFSVVEIICIAVSVIDLLMTGSVVSAIILALLLVPRIPRVYVGILCAILSVAEFFITGGIATIIVTALFWGRILYKNRKHLVYTIPFADFRIYSATKNSRKLPIVCFMIFWLIRGVVFAAPDCFRDEIRFARNFFIVTQDIGRSIVESIARPEVIPDVLPESTYHLEIAESKFIEAEDPERVKLLSNNFAAYNRAEQIAEMRKKSKDNETIELRITSTRIQPGGRVHFEAIPSSETPAMGSSVMLISYPLGYTTPLNRQWLGNKYRGSVRFSADDSGVYDFGIMTRRLYDKKAKKMTSYNSNSVSVVIAPENSQLSRIFIEHIVSVLVAEGSTTELKLYGVDRNGEKYDISAPEVGTHWAVEDESKAIVTNERSYSGRTNTVIKGLSPGNTIVRAKYGSLETQSDVRVFREEAIPTIVFPGEPPPPEPVEPPNPINPPDGFVARIGERIQLEVTSFDFSKGYVFHRSSWHVYKINSETGKKEAEVANLRRGNSEKAEWIPRGTGTFEWDVTYYYSMGPRLPGKETSLPQRIVVVK